MDEARRNGTRNRGGGKDGRMAHDEKGNGTEQSKTRVGNGQRNGRDGDAERATHEETGNYTDGTEMSGDGLTTWQKNGRFVRKR